MYKKNRPTDMPIFMARLNGIVDCLKRNGYVFDCDEMLHAQAW